MLKSIILVIFLLSLSLFQVSAENGESVKIGVFFYVWYDPSSPINWQYPKIHDTPILGFYNSCDPDVIEQQISWMEQLHIDFAIICWYGYESYTYINNSTHQIFEVAKDTSTSVKFCIAVEPFNESEGGYDYERIYNYAWDHFVTPYESLYFYYDDKPLILFYQGENITRNGDLPRNEYYTVLTFGHEEYCDWVYGFAEGLRVDGVYPRNQQFSVMPRYDERTVPNRCRRNCIDPELRYLYEEQWREAIDLVNNGCIEVITITSWNEYPERTAIEPHHDSSAWNKNPYYLYHLTKKYIYELKNIPPQPVYNQCCKDVSFYALISALLVVIVIKGRWI